MNLLPAVKAFLALGCLLVLFSCAEKQQSTVDDSLFYRVHESFRPNGCMNCWDGLIRKNAFTDRRSYKEFEQFKKECKGAASWSGITMLCVQSL